MMGTSPAWAQTLQLLYEGLNILARAKNYLKFPTCKYFLTVLTLYHNAVVKFNEENACTMLKKPYNLQAQGVYVCKR